MGCFTKQPYFWVPSYLLIPRWLCLGVVHSLKLGFIGFSQGGAIAPLAASKLLEADFMVNVVGSAVSFNEQLEFEIYNDVLSAGIPKFTASLVTSAYTRRAKARRPVWWQKNGTYNPAPYIRRLKVPSLIIFGGKDTNTPTEQSLKNLQEIKS